MNKDQTQLLLHECLWETHPVKYSGTDHFFSMVNGLSELSSFIHHLCYVYTSNGRQSTNYDLNGGASYFYYISIAAHTVKERRKAFHYFFAIRTVNMENAVLWLTNYHHPKILWGHSHPLRL